MSLLPRPIALVILTLFTLSTLTLTPSAYAAPGPPNPQPCQNALSTEKLTDNYITDDRGAPPNGLQKFVDATRTGTLGESIEVTTTATFQVDFSKLQAIFAISNSDYLEGRFQTDSHRLLDLVNLENPELNTYHGPGQKIIPKLLVDEQKAKYVNYVYDKPELPESENTYADINGANPKNIWELTNQFGRPQPPGPEATNAEKETWDNTWGNYWEKIPTAYREFYKGKLEFRAVNNSDQLEEVLRGRACPQTFRTVEFVLPEFSRTVGIADQLNQTIVPCNIQSYRHGDTKEQDECGQEPTPLVSNQKPDNILGSFIALCKNLIANSSTGLGKVLKKAVTISLKSINPIKDVFAAVAPDSCIKILGRGLEGTSPYCALPAAPDSYRPDLGDSCTNPYGDDVNKLDRGNPRVVCTFSLTYTRSLIVNDNPPNQKHPDDFDNCIAVGADQYQCRAIISIWPVFRIPLLSEIWNDTLYSDENEGEAGQGVGSNQETGRCGIYCFFTPAVISSSIDPVLEDLKNLQQTCLTDPTHPACINYEQATGCTLNVPVEILAECLGYTKKDPAHAPGAGASDAKNRFLGAVEGCTGKDFVKDKALMPGAVQQELGVSDKCSP